MKYNIASTQLSLEISDAVRLTQRLVPLARVYRDLYTLRKGFVCVPDGGTEEIDKLPDNVREELHCSMIRLSEEVMRQVLSFIGENPYDISPE